jgi:hypothetical protein
MEPGFLIPYFENLNGKILMNKEIYDYVSKELYARAFKNKELIQYIKSDESSRD